MKLILAPITLAFLLTPALAQQKTPPTPGPARPLNLPKITEKKLPNGLTVVLAPLPNVRGFDDDVRLRTLRVLDEAV